MTFGSLFAGIGGFDLGFERAGMRCEWQVEINPFCRQVLEKHWPDVRRHDDVKTFPPEGDWTVDVICGGFPCQDISNAGKGAGIDGERSGLWSEFSRIICDLRPRYVVVENVAALLARGLDRVLGDLACSGYDAEWQSIPASTFGAWQRRNRVWILAYPAGDGWTGGGSDDEGRNADCSREHGEPAGSRATGGASNLSGSPGVGLQGERSSRKQVAEAFGGPGLFDWHGGDGGIWRAEPDVGRVANGIPGRVDRLHALGNAVVPQVAEWIGRRIMETHN
jgi:DNA (cytosine-5)-methyltransferase 1